MADLGTGTDVLDTSQAGPKAIRGGVLRVGGYAAGMLVALAAAPFVIRHLGVADFGRYATVVSLGTVVASVTDAGLTALGIREYTQRDVAGRQPLMRDLLGARLALSLLGALAATLFAIVAGYDDVMVLGTLAVSGGVVLAALQSTLTVPLASSLRMGLVTGVEFFKQAVTTLLLLGAVLLGAGLLTFLFVPVPAGLLTLVVLAPLVVRIAPIVPSLNVSGWLALLRQTFAFAAASALNVIYYRVAIIVMSLIATERETGLFSTSFRVMEILLLLPALMVSAAFPILARAARDDSARLRYAAQRMFEVALIVGLWMALCLVAGAPTVVAILGGSEFAAAADVLRLQAPAVAATFVLAVWGHTLLALDRQRTLLIANGTAFAGILVLSVALVPAAQAEGAAIATTIVELGLAGAYVVALGRHRPDLRPSLRIVPRIAVAAGAAVAPAFVLAPPVAVLACTVIFFALLLALRAIPEEVSHALLKRG